MLVSASAFGVTAVFVVGQKKLDLEEQEPLLTSLSCRVMRMATLNDCRMYCMERNIRIIGVEIMPNANSIADHPFHGDSAFMMGNEVPACLCSQKDSVRCHGRLNIRVYCLMQGSGMNSAQMAICDDFVYIPQYGGGTASLNVTVAASIVLQRFALWAKRLTDRPTS